MSGTTVFRAADRFVDAQLWWVASELCRRHSRLRIRELAHDELGTFIEVVSWPDVSELRIGFSRVSGIRILGHDDFAVTPTELLEVASPHAVLKAVEAEHGIGGPGRFPPTTRETIGYRAIAYVLGTMVNSRHSWTVRGERPEDPSVVHGGAWLSPVRGWPSIPQLREQWAIDAAHDALYNKAPAHAWLLMRDLEVVGLFDLHGRVHLATASRDLFAAHRASGSDIAQAVVWALGSHMRL
ncbi:TY-Chap2 family putative peptide chaperone [Demequina rhizosphaerae]|uniref:TY-Chap2 family putative peptide chaperone n=1 Tax=Demequina rhizosphaerae TaxID=1638985 RepID=UPI000780C77C|nr:hypothetical protein [Demequina rhizosphaerae]